ncbi:MAG: VCBS repeat-containing protein [Kiritimatiellaeota bacterium]|nr:VCBS repeat-containing protein [Kiritimatiellota bacterium]
MYTNYAYIFKGKADGIESEPLKLLTEDAQRVFVIKNTKKKAELLFINHYARSSVGFDKAYVYYGGKDGYAPDRRAEVPCWCAVDSLSCDLDDDGWSELVVCNNSENSPHLDPGSHVHHFGPNGFEPEKTYLLPTKIGWGGCCADFNRDGYLDLAFVYNHYKDLIIFYGSKDGFKKSTVITLVKPDGTPYGSPRWICAADLNMDGYIDLIIPLIDANRTLILWGSENGFSLERKTELAVFWGACARVADLSKNGYPDLIIGTHTETPKNGELTAHNPHHSFVHIYWNGPDGLQENNKTVLRADACDALCVADFNNDGWLDIFACSYHGGKDRDINSFLYWNRAGKFHELDRQLLFTHSASGTIAADFNEDGYIDLAVANHKVWGDHKGASSVWWNGPDGFDARKCTDLPTCGPHGMSSVEPGNQLDRSPEEYYISAPYQVTENLLVKSVSWEGDIPPKTWVKAAVRIANNKETLATAEWGKWLHAEETLNVKASSGSWIQYKLALGATNSLRSPRLTQISVTFIQP